MEKLIQHYKEFSEMIEKKLVLSLLKKFEYFETKECVHFFSLHKEKKRRKEK